MNSGCQCGGFDEEIEIGIDARHMRRLEHRATAVLLVTAGPSIVAPTGISMRANTGSVRTPLSK